MHTRNLALHQRAPRGRLATWRRPYDWHEGGAADTHTNDDTTIGDDGDDTCIEVDEVAIDVD